MNFNAHYEIRDTHALFGGSNYYWVNDEDDELYDRILRGYSTKIGTVLHRECADRILFREKILKNDKRSFVLPLLREGIPRDAFNLDTLFPTMQTYVNDAIGFGMTPEQPLKYSDNAHGTADTICCDENKKILRIHDLKTGITPAKMDQLEIYAAFFFLEYGKAYRLTPNNTFIELRIYQSGEVLVHNPEPDRIRFIMDRTIRSDKLRTQMG